MVFGDQLVEIIKDERKSFLMYFVWLVVVVVISIAFLAFSLTQDWFQSQLGPTLSSAFLLLLSKPPFSEMMKRKERIKTLETLKNLAMVTPAGSPEAQEIEKLIIKVFRDMLKK